MTTDLDALLAAGLSEEEAQMVLARRASKAAPTGSRLGAAIKALAEATRKVGARPVVLTPEGNLEKSEPQDPEALDRFYKRKAEWEQWTAANIKQAHAPKKPSRAAVPEEDVSQDPEDWK